jgi:hypothetical protein
VPEAFIPKTGIRFDELEDAYIFYCDCAKLVGFDVRTFTEHDMKNRYE